MSEGWPDGEHDGKPSDGGRRVSPRLVIVAVASVLALIVIFQNTKTVPVHFLVFAGDMHLWIFALLMILLGAGLGQLTGWIRRRRRADPD